jgi:hypothetical protein
MHAEIVIKRDNGEIVHKLVVPITPGSGVEKVDCHGVMDGNVSLRAYDFYIHAEEVEPSRTSIHDITIVRGTIWRNMGDHPAVAMIGEDGLSRLQKEYCEHCEETWAAHGELEKDDATGQLAWLVCPGDVIAETDKGLFYAFHPHMMEKLFRQIEEELGE